MQINNVDKFAAHFCRVFNLLSTDFDRVRFLAALVGLMEEQLDEEFSIRCMDAALGMAQGVQMDPVPGFDGPVAAIVPKLQIVGGAGIRQQNAERSQGLMLVKR